MESRMEIVSVNSSIVMRTNLMWTLISMAKASSIDEWHKGYLDDNVDKLIKDYRQELDVKDCRAASKLSLAIVNCLKMVVSNGDELHDLIIHMIQHLYDIVDDIDKFEEGPKRR